MNLTALFFAVIAAVCSLGKGAFVDDEIHPQIPEVLKECYTNTSMLVRDNLYPMNTDTFVSLIQHIEDTVGNQADIISLVGAILRRFRFDGIEHNPNVEPSEEVIPYGPVGPEYFTYKLLMTRLLHNPGYTLPRDILDLTGRCTLHWMLSNSVDRWARGNDGDNCRQANNLKSSSSRYPRNADKIADAELITNDKTNDTTKANSTEVPIGPQKSNYRRSFTSEPPLSDCPIENGVIYDKYGSVSPGIVLAGIAAGLSPESIEPKNLLGIQPRGFPGGDTFRKKPPKGPIYPQDEYYRGGYPNNRVTFQQGGGGRGGYDQGGLVENTWACTIAGLTANVALLLGPTMGPQMTIGLGGNWNSSYDPKYYFLDQPVKDALTDARIRGGIDGLILSKIIKESYDAAPSALRLSDVLHRYYSEDGFMKSEISACNRKDALSSVMTQQKLQAQTIAFGSILPDVLPLLSSVLPEGLQTYSEIASNRLMRYIPQMPGQVCGGGGNIPLPDPKVDLLVVLDFSWEYRDAEGFFAALAGPMNLGSGSNFTLMDANSGNIVIESISRLSDLYTLFNSSMYLKVPPGFDFKKSLQALKIRYLDKLEYVKRSHQTGVDIPSVVLFMKQSSMSMTDTGKDEMVKKLRYFREILPDVKLLYFVTNSPEEVKIFAENPDQDIFIKSDIMKDVILLTQKIASIPQHITNPTCGRGWSGMKYESPRIVKCLSPKKVDYYRIHPNYFLKSDSGKVLTITAEGTNSMFDICTSRYSQTPANFSVNSYSKSSLTSVGFNCTQVTRGSSYDLYINSNTCPSSYAKECNPIFISVTNKDTGANPPSGRNDCPTFDGSRYTLQHRGLTCYSAAFTFQPSIVTLVIMTTLALFKLNS